MRWKSPTGTPLEKLVLGEGEWYFSQTLMEVKAAARFGLRPLEFWASSEMDQAWMLCLLLTENKMLAWERLQEKQAVEATRRSPPKGRKRK